MYYMQIAVHAYITVIVVMVVSDRSTVREREGACSARVYVLIHEETMTSSGASDDAWCSRIAADMRSCNGVIDVEEAAVLVVLQWGLFTQSDGTAKTASSGVPMDTDEKFLASMSSFFGCSGNGG